MLPPTAATSPAARPATAARPLAGARVSLAVGPGHHGGEIVSALVAQGALHRAIRYWPDFAVDVLDGGAARLREEASLPAYRHAVRALYALWRRLPGPLFRDAPRLPHYALFDQLASRFVDGCDLFVGFSQLSLHSLRRARALGARTLLEHPMCHAGFYNEIIERECRVALRGAGSNGRYSRAFLRRMEAEYAAADHISVLSSYARDSFLRAGFPAERLLRLPVGVDADHFTPATEAERARRAAELAEGRPLRILCVSRLELLKGTRYLLRAFRRLRGRKELCLVGAVFPEVAQHLARDAGPDVRVIGAATPQELPDWYRSADLFCFPTLCDGFGLVILEAMAAGLPVVCTRESGGPDVIRDGESGLLVPSRDEEAVADGLQSLMESPERRRALGEAARRAVLGGFTLPQYRARIVAAYGAILAAPPGQRVGAAWA